MHLVRYRAKCSKTNGEVSMAKNCTALDYSNQLEADLVKSNMMHTYVWAQRKELSIHPSSGYMMFRRVLVAESISFC